MREHSELLRKEASSRKFIAGIGAAMRQQERMKFSSHGLELFASDGGMDEGPKVTSIFPRSPLKVKGA